MTEEKSALGAQALGWRALQRRDWPSARHWFETSIGWSGFDPLTPPEKLEAEQAKLIEGYVQALRGSGEGARAEDVAFAWRAASPALGALYLQIVTEALNDDASGLTSERISRFAAFTESRHDVDAAAALGWRAYRGKAHADAIGWFAKAVSWAPDGKPPVKVAEGYALSLRAAGRLLDAEIFRFPLRVGLPGYAGDLRLHRRERARRRQDSVHRPAPRPIHQRDRRGPFRGRRAGAGMAAVEGRQLRLRRAVVPQGERLERRQLRGRRHRARPGASLAKSRRLPRGRGARLRLA